MLYFLQPEICFEHMYTRFIKNIKSKRFKDYVFFTLGEYQHIVCNKHLLTKFSRFPLTTTLAQNKHKTKCISIAVL